LIRSQPANTCTKIAPQNRPQQANKPRTKKKQKNQNQKPNQKLETRNPETRNLPAMPSKPTELTPETFTGIELDAPKKEAAGMTAIVSSAKHLLAEMGVGRATQVMLNLNQKGGIDCPGCAWPDPDDERSRLGEYCENGAKAIAEEATSKKLTPDFFAQYSIAEMGEWSDYEIGKKGRIAQPMILAENSTHYTPIEWDEAFRLIAAELHALNSPDEAIFYTSGRTSNEAAFLYQLFVRIFGTNNLPDCAHLCHESSGVALTETLGIGKGSVKLDDLHKAEVIMVLGQNPGTNHPRMLSALQKAKANGATIIAINPLSEAGLVAFRNPQKVSNMLGHATKLTDIFLQVKINGDMALLKALMWLLWQKEQETGGVFDHSFIQAQTTGYDSFIQELEKQDFSQLVQQSGVDEALIRQTADLLASKTKIVACWAMGLTQHKNAVATIQEVVNLLLLKGSISKEGAGTCPVRGHSNVQGDRTMGITEKPKPVFLDALEKHFGKKMPREKGLHVIEAIQGMRKGTIKTFIALGGNFLSAAPDTSFTAEALRNTRLTVHISTKLNRSHLVHGKTALILPCLSRSDADMQASGQQFVSVENSMGVVHTSKGRLKPVSPHLRSEVAIVTGLAHAVLGDSPINWGKYVDNYDLIRDEIEATIAGFDRYNERVRQPEGFYLPNGAREGAFTTPDQKAHFTVHSISPIALKNNELLMMTIRSHDQFNTTIYGLNDRYRGIHNERRVILMNTQDIEKQGLKPNDVVNLFNHTDGIERTAPHFIVLPYNIPEGCCATYFPETNTLVPISSIADKSNTPTSKSVVITVQAAAPSP
jgi:molybdopterin-dependent oxidoreductase alpha subunit